MFKNITLTFPSYSPLTSGDIDKTEYSTFLFIAFEIMFASSMWGFNSRRLERSSKNLFIRISIEINSLVRFFLQKKYMFVRVYFFILILSIFRLELIYQDYLIKVKQLLTQFIQLIYLVFRRFYTSQVLDLVLQQSHIEPSQRCKHNFW